MTHRERALAAFRFDPTDRPPCDLLENMLWERLRAYFEEIHSLTDREEILDFIGADFRWVKVENPFYMRSLLGNTVKAGALREESIPLSIGTLSDALFDRPLRDATLEDIEAIRFPSVDDIIFPDFKAARERWPDHAIVFMPYNYGLFMSACDSFGFEEALIKMASEPEIFDALIRRMHEFNMEALRVGLEKARGYVDIIWTWDDFATQESLIMNPALWRERIKPYIAEEIGCMRDYGFYTLYHSCGAIRSVLPDLIEIGVNGVEVFQVSAKGMDAAGIARDFGGKMTFYGGIDVQTVLLSADERETREAVRHNAACFKSCGGYIVANSHHGVDGIRTENIIAMCDEAHKIRYR